MLIRGNPSEQVLDAARDLAKRQYSKNASLCVISSAVTGRVLVVRRFKDLQVGLPCGKADAGEMGLQAAYRELYEETGLRNTDLMTRLVYMQTVMFEGTQVEVFVTMVADEPEVKAAPGFENETEPYWIKPQELADMESRFQSFNIVAMFNAGVMEQN